MIDVKVIFYNTVVIVQSADKNNKIKKINQKSFVNKKQAYDYLYSHYVVFCDGKPNTDKEDFIKWAGREEGVDLFTVLDGEAFSVKFYIQEQDDFNLASDAYFEFDTACRMEDVDMELEGRGISASDKEIREMAIEANDYLSDTDTWRYAVDYAIEKWQNSFKEIYK